MRTPLQTLHEHQACLRQCRRCARMTGPPVVGEPVGSPVLLVGQAPGPKEIEAARPFAWTAGKALFAWFDQIGLPEEVFRRRIYMAAVCRCFPGKNPKGGDRVPDRTEIANCAPWLDAEIMLLRPALILPVGRLAITRFMPVKRLDEVVGRMHRVTRAGFTTDALPLPHPSGASVWHRTEPGRSLLLEALALIQTHPAWQTVLKTDYRG
jgi:uracil-DNA glycosylase